MAFATCVAGALVSGVLLTFALPLGERAYLAWIAFVPLLLATRGRGFVVGFLAAIASVFVAAGVALSGVAYAIRTEGPDGWIFTAFGLYGFSMALVVALWADRSVERRPAWWFAAVATLLEAVLMVHLPANLALTQYRTQPVVALAGVFGIWGISSLIWWVNLSIARMSLRQGLAVGTAAVAIGAALGHSSFPSFGSSSLRVGVVQTESADEETLVRLHREATANGAEVVVWPEFAGIAIARPDDASALAAIARLPGSAPFVTSFRDDHEPLPHNVAALFSRRGESERYFKRQLFGSETAMHTPGDRAAAAKLGDRTYGLNVCFDSCFPSIIRDTAALGDVRAILLPTIDPPSRHGFIAAMHAAYSPFRCVEQGVALIRADGYAYSHAVAPNGTIVGALPPGEGVAVYEVPFETHRTLPRSLGDWWLVVCGVGAIASQLLEARARRRNAEPTPPVVP